jgi:hypothetical protein
MYKSLSGQLFRNHIEDSKYYLILFMLWPFLAFATALTNYRQKEAKKVVYIFLIYYGLTFVIGNPDMDSARYAFLLKTTAALPFSDFFKIVGGLYSSDTSVDIVQPLITFIVSRFTENQGFLFAVFAALFGFFYLKSIDLLHNCYQEKPGWNSLVFLVFFVVVLPITSINGFRMWTAAWIFFYGAYHVILYRNPKYLLLALGSSLVHFSFLSANVILLIYYFAGNRYFIYLTLLITSFVLPQFIAPVFQSISLRLGGGLQQRYTGYSNEDYVLERKESLEQVNWFVTLSQDLIFYYLIIAIIIIYLVHRDLMQDKTEKNLFNFLLLFLSFVNFGKEIPSFGSRFQIVFILFATLYVFLYYLKLPGSKLTLLPIAGLFPMALYVAVDFRIASESINSWMFLPGFGMPMFVPGIPLAGFLFH